ncbi:hypothetical protein R1flu_022132 [Riccia fluitans]|uniref:Uncharacterized protein n=1 Tax=Riccia fluitans TaxID=41844 RepID=A0ABD1ZUF4_9MARC
MSAPIVMIRLVCRCLRGILAPSFDVPASSDLSHSRLISLLSLLAYSLTPTVPLPHWRAWSVMNILPYCLGVGSFRVISCPELVPSTLASIRSRGGRSIREGSLDPCQLCNLLSASSFVIPILPSIPTGRHHMEGWKVQGPSSFTLCLAPLPC